MRQYPLYRDIKEIFQDNTLLERKKQLMLRVAQHGV